MTVCIAAVCESGKKIVLAADRMLTYPPPMNLEFETEERKIEVLATSCVALASGGTAQATEILDKTRKKFSGIHPAQVSQVLDVVKNEYVLSRMARIDETIINATLGSDYLKFQQKGGTLPGYLQTQAQMFQQFAMLSQQFNLNVELIIAGIDDLGAHISVVTNPGTLTSLDKLGYGSIGSGGIHATIYLSLHGQTSHREFFESLYDVYLAKRVSEVAPGVGPSTDLAIVESTGVWHCTEPVMKVLQELFEETNKKQGPKLDELKKVYNEQHKS